MHSLMIRGRTYCVRFIIPKDRWEDAGHVLQSPTGRCRDIVKTLGTRDHREAVKRRSKAWT
ncbi:hypothetical protein AA13595_2599 [Gluconacetobacter johannae DSM 13595]|nr:hypothetical protein AA13595_2599 [Gluconacetobacter johannae DSM 13595]